MSKVYFIRNLDQEVKPVQSKEVEEFEKQQQEVIKQQAEKQKQIVPDKGPKTTVRSTIISALSLMKGMEFATAINMARKVREAQKQIKITEKEYKTIELAFQQQERWPAYIKFGTMNNISE